MQYEKALEAWGARRLMNYYTGDVKFTVKDVRVSMYFNEGYACCGGQVEGCYCSFAESPRAEVRITGTKVDEAGAEYRATTTIDHDEFDFAEILREICESADGVVSSD